MPIAHQEKGFEFVIEAKDKEPPKVHIKGAKGKYLLVRIGKPEEELPYIEKFEKVDQDEVDWAWGMIADHQVNFLTAWKRIHAGEWKACPEPVVMELGAKPKTEYRLKLKPKAKKDEIKEALGGIQDRRFLPLQKKLIGDLDKANFKTIEFGLYMRLCGWSHAGGSYSSTTDEVKVLCEAVFGYALPEKVGKYAIKKYRYMSGKGLVGVWTAVSRYHEERLKK